MQSGKNKINTFFHFVNLYIGVFYYVEVIKNKIYILFNRFIIKICLFAFTENVVRPKNK